MNNIEEAKRHLTASFNAESSAANHFERENAKAIALIAIAEQLQLGNLIRMNCVDDETYNHFSTKNTKRLLGLETE